MRHQIEKILKTAVEFLRKAYSHRHPVNKKYFLLGILIMLGSWQLIGIGITFHKVQNSSMLLSLTDYSYQMLLSALLLLLISVGYRATKGGNLRDGWDYLKISRNDEILSEGKVTHLSYGWRVGAIYLRALFATGGYYLFELARVFIGIFDNSSLHGADALIYAILFGWWIENRTSRSVYRISDWIGMGTSALAIVFAFLFESSKTTWSCGLIGVAEGFSSAIALAIIVMLSNIIVYHDSIIRIAFHNCVFGAGSAIIIGILLLTFSSDHSYAELIGSCRMINFKTASLASACYALALLGFLGSYRLIQPTLIAMMGNYLGIATGLLLIIRTGKADLQTCLVSLLLFIGSLILGVSEWQKEKSREKESPF